MQYLRIICLILATIICTSATITESELNQFYDDCFDPLNHPLNDSFEEDDDEPTWNYDCDEDCKEDLDAFIQDVKDINSKQAVRPCDEWWAFQQSAEYDSNDINPQLLFKFVECLDQLYNIIQNNDQSMVFNCQEYKISNYLSDNSISEEEEEELIFQLDDINQCQQQCKLNLDCDDDCLAFIEDNFDNEISSCTSAGYYEDDLEDNERSQDYTEYFSKCLIENLYEVDAFNSIRQQIDLQSLYNTATLENNYTIDYSTLSNLDAGQKAFLYLDCQIQCYDYYHLYGFDDYVFEYYDNKHVILEIYGEEKFDEAYENYLDIYQYYGDEYYEESDYEFYDLDCLFCFDENGHFQEGSEEEENDCDSEYCFVEFYECIDRCTEDNCYYQTCYDRQAGQSLRQYMQDVCIGFYKLEQYLDNTGTIINLDETPSEYIESYSDCISKLQHYEENNEDREESDKKQILEYYTCLASCSEEKPALEEENKEAFQSKLILALGSLTLSILILI